MRLQKLLRVILPHKKEMEEERAPVVLRRFLKESYLRLGLSALELKSRGLWPSFVKLLDSYGFLPAKALSIEEQRQLQKNPYTVWPSKDHCVLNADALNFLASDPSLKKENYLCFVLQKLSPRAKKDWCKCLGLETVFSSERERTLALYHHLAQLNCQQKDSPNTRRDTLGNKLGHRLEHTIEHTHTHSIEEKALWQLPEFLDEVFPDDLSFSPMAWFYRDVLSFYRSIEETEKKIQRLPPLAQRLLPLFKSGRLFVLAAHPPEPSQALRWRILRTKEHRSPFTAIEADQFSSFLNLHSHSEQKKEGMLF